MRKLTNILILTFVMVVSLSSTVFAARTEYVEGKRVYDYANLFTYDEEEALEELAKSVELKAETEFYVLTIDDAEGKSAMEYADDFGDNGRFGYEEEYGTYIVMLIDMDNREVWISTSGRAIEYLNDYRIDKTLDDVFEYMPDGRYYKAAEAYIKTAGRYMLSDPSDDYKSDDYNYDDTYDDTYYYDDGTYSEDLSTSELVIVSFVVSAVVSGIVLVIMLCGAKTKMTAGSADYIGQGGLMINHRDDTFTHTTTVKRKIETDSGTRSGGGGSSVHRSSGGHSHGGGGRRF